MKIYTKSGDLGETSLWGGGRVKKSHPRVNAYGSLDEANSMIGLALSFLPVDSSNTTQNRLTRVQNELFQLGAELATSAGTKNSCALIQSLEIEALEKEIDEMEAVLEPLKNFILPSGGSAGSAIHLARTIVRRSERECVDLAAQEKIRPEVIQYLNRLSDYLFVMARAINHSFGQSETKWFPPKVEKA